MAYTVIKWEIIRGIDERMISEFLTSVFFSENEMSLEGIVRQFVDGKQDVSEYAMQKFAESCGEDYRGYVAELTGDERIGANSKSAILSYVEARGLQGECSEFISEYQSRWDKDHDKDEQRENMVNTLIQPIFDQLQKRSMYIYRDSDHWGLHFVKTQE